MKEKIEDAGTLLRATVKKVEKGHATFRDAINQAFREEMRRDPTVVIWGEDVESRALPNPTTGLFEEFGGERVRNTPIVEGAIVGMTVGAALTGLRPVGEIGFGPLLSIAFNEVFFMMGSWRQRHGGHFPMPIVVRTPLAMPGAGVDHAASIEACFIHASGLRVVAPSTPYDAKGLMKSAIRSEDAVLYLDHYGLYNNTGPVPEGDYVVPIGKADVKRPGEDVTIVSYSIMMPKVMAAAEQLSKEGINAEVVDLRSLVPMDEETLLNSVKKTGRLVIAHEAMKRGGVGGEMAARVAEKGFKYLKAPILRIGAKSIPLPRITARLEAAIIPQVVNVVAGVKSIM